MPLEKAAVSAKKRAISAKKSPKSGKNRTIPAKEEQNERKEDALANFIEKCIGFLGKKQTPEELDAVYEKFKQKVAFKTLAIYIAVSYIAGSLSKCPVQVIERGKPAPASARAYRLNVNPNPNQSASQFWNAVVTRICREADALVILHNGDALFLADAFEIDKKPLKDHCFVGVTIDEKQMTKRYKASDVYYFRLESERVRGLINSLYEDYAELMSAAIEGFKQGHGRKYKLKLDAQKAGDKDFEKNYEEVVKKDLESFLTSENAVYPQYAGYDLEEMRHEADSGAADVVTMRKEVFDLVAQAYKIPTSMMYGTTNNTAEVVRQFLTFAVDPIAEMISDELTRKTFTYEEWAAGSRIVLDTKRINHIDIFDVADKVDKLIASGAFSIDDVLTQLGYQPLNTEFSKQHFMTKNYALAEDAMNPLAVEGGETNG